jgi:hypothetical protein
MRERFSYRHAVEGGRGDRARARPPVSLGPRRAQGGGGSGDRGVKLHLLVGGDISGNGLSKLFLTIAAAFA